MFGRFLSPLHFRPAVGRCLYAAARSLLLLSLILLRVHPRSSSSPTALLVPWRHAPCRPQHSTQKLRYNVAFTWCPWIRLNPFSSSSCYQLSHSINAIDPAPHRSGRTSLNPFLYKQKSWCPRSSWLWTAMMYMSSSEFYSGWRQLCVHAQPCMQGSGNAACLLCMLGAVHVHKHVACLIAGALLCRRNTPAASRVDISRVGSFFTYQS
jgi:hypothetical protein